MTLEQMRASFAWNQVTNFNSDEFKNLAKGAPALIMNNGLMASLAFWQSRNTMPATNLVAAILGWLHSQNIVAANFANAMTDLQQCNSTRYMRATRESLEFLKWLRQFASAVG